MFFFYILWVFSKNWNTTVQFIENEMCNIFYTVVVIIDLLLKKLYKSCELKINIRIFIKKITEIKKIAIKNGVINKWNNFIKWNKMGFFKYRGTNPNRILVLYLIVWLYVLLVMSRKAHRFTISILLYIVYGIVTNILLHIVIDELL